MKNYADPLSSAESPAGYTNKNSNRPLRRKEMQIEENVIHRGRRPRSERPRGIALDKIFPLLMPE